ncbi:hypothetical protein [Ancylobacter sp. FA202]|uniref:hypothetical protein n=1 Tax=Ancylobacter sp. FA202 TaxID=1111106 RepID=UPI000381282C|nr:hypothetical protein [Ancylobacter sp. FA202]
MNDAMERCGAVIAARALDDLENARMRLGALSMMAGYLCHTHDNETGNSFSILCIDTMKDLNEAKENLEIIQARLR